MGSDGSVRPGEGFGLLCATLSWIAASVAPAVLEPWPVAVVAVSVLALGGLSLFAAGRGSATSLSEETHGRRSASAAGLVGGVLGLALLVGHLGARADDRYEPLSAGPLDETVVVLDAAEPIGSAGWRIELRLPDRSRVEATAYGQAGVELARASVGDRLAVGGRLLPVGQRPWLRTRHIEGRASLDRVEVRSGPSVGLALVEGVRDRVVAGGHVLDERPRALYLGLVLGDDRFQPFGQRLRFREAGLTHLLAVSGQNLAFVLAAAGPLIRRVGRRTRIPLVAVILVLFALMTRLEPSVLRATATAALALWSSWSRPPDEQRISTRGLGHLSLAVVVLLAIDPFLVDSIGFQLSVAASGGIVLLRPALARRLPGPEFIVEPLATTLAAQAGVAPIIVHYFGPFSLAAIPANLAAGWAAGLVMVWGMTVGLVAGVLPDVVAAVVQAPVRLRLWWLELVAAFGAAIPAPRPGLVGLAGLGALGLLGSRLGSQPRTATAVVAAGLILAASMPAAPDQSITCGRGITWYPGGRHRSSALVISPAASEGSVDDCLGRGIRGATVVVLERGDRRTGALAAGLREVLDVERVLAPPQHMVREATRQVEPFRVVTGAGVLDVFPSDDGRGLVVGRAPP